MSELAREKLLELCARAVGDKLVYSCGEAPNYETYDSKTEFIKPVPPKAWYVNKTANESEQYFTSGELYEYLSQLSRSSGINLMSDYITLQNGNDIIQINKDKFSGFIDTNLNEDIISLAYEDDNGIPKVVKIYKDKDPAAFAEALDFLQSLK